ncbi:MAG TPA: sigma-70 family RNA polymerase sigma factor [Kofleriaceae bacterium]
MTLADAIAASRAAWPGVDVPDDVFAGYLADRIDTPIDGVLASLCVSDLWLACAIGRGDAAALRAFEDQLAHVGAAIAHLDGGSALVGDVTQAVRERVLAAAAGGKAKIGDYRGRGDLRGWLRVIAVREALQLMRARRRETPIPDDLATKLQDPGIELADAERRVYREAFTAALATLTPRDRNLLRQQYVYGATIDELGALYAVHRATAARWIAQIRDTLLRRTRHHIGEALRLTGDDLDSAMGRIGDHLDYSLRHTLSAER